MLALWVALGQPAVAQVLPPDTYRFWVHSQPGDPWGQVFHKSDWSYQANDGQFICLGYDWLHDGSLNHLTFSFNGNNGEIWDVVFTTPAVIEPGEYESLANNGRPGFYVGGLGGSCMTGSGKFKILQVVYEGSGDFIHVKRFAATFEYHCYGLQPALTGGILFNSNGILPPSKLQVKEPSSLPDATAGLAYMQKIEAEGGTPPYLWEVTDGQLPPGFSLDANGVLSGMPTARGRYAFTARCTDSASIVNGYPSQVVSSAFTVTVNPAGFDIDEGLPPTATKGNAYAYHFPAVGGVLPYQWSVIEGQLPVGLSLATDGGLSGTPSSAGSFTFTLRASDSAGHQSERKYAIKVIDPPRIASADYKAKKGKLMVIGEKFDIMATLLIDGQEVKPKAHDAESFSVKHLSLGSGLHEIRVANPDGGVASVTITVE